MKSIFAQNKGTNRDCQTERESALAPFFPLSDASLSPTYLLPYMEWSFLPKSFRSIPLSVPSSSQESDERRREKERNIELSSLALLTILIDGRGRAEKKVSEA